MKKSILLCKLHLLACFWKLWQAKCFALVMLLVYSFPEGTAKPSGKRHQGAIK